MPDQLVPHSYGNDHSEALKLARRWTTDPTPNMTPTLAEFKKVCRALLEAAAHDTPSQQPKLTADEIKRLRVILRRAITPWMASELCRLALKGLKK